MLPPPHLQRLAMAPPLLLRLSLRLLLLQYLPLLAPPAPRRPLTPQRHRRPSPLSWRAPQKLFLRLQKMKIGM